MLNRYILNSLIPNPELGVSEKFEKKMFFIMENHNCIDATIYNELLNSNFPSDKLEAVTRRFVFGNTLHADLVILLFDNFYKFKSHFRKEIIDFFNQSDSVLMNSIFEQNKHVNIDKLRNGIISFTNTATMDYTDVMNSVIDNTNYDELIPPYKPCTFWD